MTECGPLISYSPSSENRMASCGRIVDRVEARIDSTDSAVKPCILHVKGENVMLGYYKNPEATEACMSEDGWLSTGDICNLDSDGFLYIRGRDKNMILGPSGQNIYPEEIEDKLNNLSYVAESLIIDGGDGRLVALIYPDIESLTSQGLDNDGIMGIMEENIKTLNSSLPAYSQVQRFKLMSEEFEKNAQTLHQTLPLSVKINWSAHAMVSELFMSHTALQAVIIISVIIAFGLALGKIRVWGISLGVTFVFFAGILAGHIGLSIDPTILHYTENLGLVLFVYELGLKVGPGFFSSFRKGGLELNMLGLGVLAIGTLMAVLCTLCLGIPIGEATGLLCGATTNTPALGAAQQALEQVGRSASGAALSCAVTYPLGVVGVILAIIALRGFLPPLRRTAHPLRRKNLTAHS